MKKCILLLLAITSICLASVTPNEALEVAEFHIEINHDFARLPEETALQNQEDNYTVKSINEITDPEGFDILAYVVHLEPSGYVIIPNSKYIVPVLAYSFNSEFRMEDVEINTMLDLIRVDIKNRLNCLNFTDQEILDENNNEWLMYLNRDNRLLDTYSEMEIYGPLLDTDWGQGSPYNDLCPIDVNSGSRSITGCVATAMAQVFDYFEWPTDVTFYEYDSYYSAYTDPYMWIDAPNASVDTFDYNGAGVHPTNHTIAQLMHACGVSVEMNYSSRASGTWVYAWHVLTYWRYSYARDVDGESPSILTSMASSIQNDKPVLMSIYGSPGGHQIVTDGYNSTNERFHLDMGWDGYSNGWYSLPDGMPSDFTVISAAIVDITPPRYATLNVPTHTFTDIVDALESARPGDTIVVADGCYSTDGFRDIDLEAIRVTIRSENGALACTLDCAGSREESHYAFSIANGEGKEAVIDGFTIMNANYAEHGAVYISESSPTFKNCIFINNSTTGKGGAVHVNWGFPIFENCIFSENQARLGGAIYLYDSDPLVVNCNFVSNSASYGGASYMHGFSDPIIFNSIFYENLASANGSDLYLDYNDGAECTPIVEFCNIDPTGIYEVEGAGEVSMGSFIITVDPQFEENFSLSEESYCINAGGSTLGDYIQAPTNDIYGNIRPQGETETCISPFDIGAVESEYAPENRPPAIWNIPDEMFINAGGEILHEFTVTDPEYDMVTTSLTGPADAYLIGERYISWIAPDVFDDYEITVIASDGEYSDTAICTIHVVNGLCGELSGTLTLEDSPYHVACDVIVPSGEELSIEPGVEIVFNGHFSITVENDARMIAQGTEENPILFTSIDSLTQNAGINLIYSANGTLLEHCIIEYANADFSETFGNGGAVYGVSGTPTFNSVIVRNCASSNNGAGMYFEYSEVSMNNVTIENCMSNGNAGAIYFFESSADLEECTFEGNYSTFDGGALYFNHSYPSMENCEISMNISQNNGGGIYLKGSSVEIENNLITGNESIFDGGGVFITETSGNVTENTITGNNAREGAGIFTQNNQCTLERNIIADNEAIAGGGIAIRKVSDLPILTNLIIDNIALNGGGIFCSDSANVLLINSTVAGNEAYMQGGGFYADSGAYPIIHNTIIWENSSDDMGDEIFIAGSGIVFMCTYSDINRSGVHEGYGVVMYSDGCINADPIYIDDNYNIDYDSPCANAGNDMFETSDGSLTYAPYRDINNIIRTVGGTMDIGAYETENDAITESITPQSFNISVSPNPFNSVLNIRTSPKSKVEIYNVKGELVHKTIAQTENIKWIPSADIVSGIYTIKTTTYGKAESIRTVYIK